MRFKACYFSHKQTPHTYWRTVDADSLPEAVREAMRYVRKDYRLIETTQDLSFNL